MGRYKGVLSPCMHWQWAGKTRALTLSAMNRMLATTPAARLPGKGRTLYAAVQKRKACAKLTSLIWLTIWACAIKEQTHYLMT